MQYSHAQGVVFVLKRTNGTLHVLFVSIKYPPHPDRRVEPIGAAHTGQPRPLVYFIPRRAKKFPQSQHSFRRGRIQCTQPTTCTLLNQ